MRGKASEKVLKAILANNSRISDRAIGKAADVSQPCVSRIRESLEKAGMISYQVIPDLGQLGFEIISLGVSREASKEEILKEPRIIFAYPSGTGVGKYPCLCVSVHRDFSDYLDFRRRFNISSETLLCASEKPVKPLSFKNLV